MISRLNSYVFLLRKILIEYSFHYSDLIVLGTQDMDGDV
jgi:hypothetical protein